MVLFNFFQFLIDISLQIFTKGLLRKVLLDSFEYFIDLLFHRVFLAVHEGYGSLFIICLNIYNAANNIIFAYFINQHNILFVCIAQFGQM